jgi:predicted permease
LLLAVWGVDLIVALNPRDIPRAEEIGIDAGVLAFTLLVSLLTGVIFGLVPALQGSKVNMNESLKESSRAASSGLRRNRVRSLIVVSEIALALVLLAGAGLMIKSLLRLTDVNLGFNPENVLTMHASLSQTKYPKASQRAAFHRELLQRVEHLPGVESVGLVSPLPLAGDSVQEFFIEGRPLPAPNQGFNTNLRRCSSGYFRAMEIPLLRGRIFDERDTIESEQVVIINETLARRFWPDEDPIGKRISFSGPEGPWNTIIGVVGDTRHLKLDAEAGLEMYRVPGLFAIAHPLHGSCGAVASRPSNNSQLDKKRGARSR